MNSLMGAFSHVLSDMKNLRKKVENDIERIEHDWLKSMELPRKKKKKIRKQLQTEYNIAKFALQTIPDITNWN